MTLRSQLGSTEVIGVHLRGVQKREGERKAWGVGNQASGSGRPKDQSRSPTSKEQIVPCTTSCPRVQEELKCLQNHVAKPAHPNLSPAVQKSKIQAGLTWEYRRKNPKRMVADQTKHYTARTKPLDQAEFIPDVQGRLKGRKLMS